MEYTKARALHAKATETHDNDNFTGDPPLPGPSLPGPLLSRQIGLIGMKLLKKTVDGILLLVSLKPTHILSHSV